MSQEIRSGNKKFRKYWFIFLFLCAGAIFFHKPLLLIGCKTLLKTAIPKTEGQTVFYEKMQWEEGAIALTGLKVKDPAVEFTVDRIELKLSGDFFRLKLKPQITVVHPQITISSEKSSSKSALSILYRSYFIQPRWEIRNGVLQLPSSSRFYFSMAPGKDDDSIGSVLFSYDPSPLVPPMLSAELAMNEGMLQMGFKLQESQLSRLLPLTALIAPGISRDWKKADGEVEFEGLVSFGPSFDIRQLHCHGAGKSIALIGPAMGIDLQTEEIKGAFSYPVGEASDSLWDKLSASFSLKRASCHVVAPLVHSPFGMDDVEGELSFEPKKEPKLILNGTFSEQNQKMPFALTGKGGIHEDQTFWSEIELVCHSQQDGVMQALLSICSYDKSDLALHLKIEDASYEHLDFLRKLNALPGQCVEGTAHVEATLLYKDGHWHKASVENCQLNDIRWYFPEQQLTVYAAQINAESAFEKNKNDVWQLDDLHFHLKAGDYLSPSFHLTELATEVAIEKGILHPSLIKGTWDGLQGEITLNCEGNPSAAIKLEGNAKALLNYFSQSNQKTNIDLPIAFRADVKIEKEEVHTSLMGTLAGDPINASAVFLLSRVSDLLLGKLPQLQLKEGEFHADLLTEKSYGAILPVFIPDFSLNGNLRCKSSFTPAHIQLQLLGEKIVVNHPWAVLDIPQLKSKPAQFNYDVAQKQWRGEIPLLDANFHQRQLDLKFESVEGILKLNGDRLTAVSLYAECHGLGVRGNLDLSLATGELSLSTSQIAGSMKSLLATLSHFPALSSINLPIEGNFSSGEKGLVLTAIGTADSHWSFKANFDNLRLPINPATAIAGGHCDVLFDSKEGRLSVEKGEGIWQLKDGTAFSVQIKRFSTQSNQALDFAVKIVDTKKEFAHFEGKAVKNPQSHWEIAFDGSSTHFGGNKLNITRCHLNEAMTPISFEMSTILRCQDLHAQAAFLQNAGFLPPNFSPKNLQEWQLEGTMQAKMSSDDLTRGFSFHAESRDLKVKGKAWSSFHLSGQKIGEKWLIEKLQAGHLSLKAAFLVDADGLSFPQFEGSWLGMSMKGSGYLKSEQKRFSCTFESLKGDLSALKLFQAPSTAFAPQGTFIAGVKLTGDYSHLEDPLKLAGEANLFLDLGTPLSMTGSNVKAIKFTYDAAGLICENLDFQIKQRASNQYLGSLKAARISSPSTGDLSIQQLQFSFTTALFGHFLDAKILPSSIKELEWEGNLEGSGDLLIAAKGNVFQGTLKPGRYGFGGKALVFDQMQVRYEKEALLMRFKTKIEEQPLWGNLQIDIAKEPYGVIKLFDNPKADGMKLQFKTRDGRFSWESMQGSCYGLYCNLSKNDKRTVSQATLLSGEIKVDGNQLALLLPSELRKGIDNFKFGKGYQWQGDLILWQEPSRGFQANGTVLGSEFEAFGYQFHRLEATMEASSERVCINNVKIDDLAGTIGIRKIELNKLKTWQLHIPQIQVRQLQPSLLRKVDGQPQNVKPFTIRNFTMVEIRGQLGDKSTLEGSGQLTFVNQFKKESSIFDTPFEMIKKIGLDPGLLTPVKGELEMELRGDKFYLLSLKNAFSEGDRSEFYLAPRQDLSYIDLDGKIHIDLNMRQDVMLKITEPFTLTIRGTLDKPRYGLQY